MERSLYDVKSFPVYFAILSLTATLLLFWLNYRLEKGLLKLDRTEKYKRKIAFDLSLVLMISGFIGGRLLHVFYEEWLYYLTYPQEITKFWKGGFVYYGGWIAALASGTIFLKSKRQPFLVWADFLTPLFSLGYALGRLACYFEGCCYGHTKIPLQLVMVWAELMLLFALLAIEKWRYKNNFHDPLIKKSFFLCPGSLFVFWTFSHAWTRFLIEFSRTDHRGAMIFDVFSLSQAISLVLVTFSIILGCKIWKTTQGSRVFE